MSIRTPALAATVSIALLIAVWVVASSWLRNAPPEPVRFSTLAAVEPPLPLPKLSATDLDGRPLDLPALLAGRPALVNLWATWCAPCIRELPSLDRLARDHGLRVIALSVDHTGADTVRVFLAKHELGALTIALDPTMESLRVLNASGVPVTLLLDSRGNIVARFEGSADWNRPEMAEQIRQLTEAAAG